MNEKDVYAFYNERVKMLYSELEARGNTLPVELLFEIHAAFDHLKCYHLGEVAEAEACRSCFSHLKRGLLDVFKLKLKGFNTNIETYLAANKQYLGYIDNGNYYLNFQKRRNEIIIKATAARLSERNEDIDSAFAVWDEVSLLINEF